MTFVVMPRYTQLVKRWLYEEVEEVESLIQLSHQPKSFLSRLSSTKKKRW
jgi:hypothetical protein